MIDLYKSSTILDTLGLEPDVTLIIFVKVLILSPGFILSGEYPQKNLY